MNAVLSNFRGACAFALLAMNTLFWCALLFAFALLKLALPFKSVRVRLDPLLNTIATSWVVGNGVWMRLTQRTRWDVQGMAGLNPNAWYLVSCNHQSWVDIFVLQQTLRPRIPFLKFFLKRQLIYVPVMGLAWWALDFPFMRRHSKADLRRNPGLRTQDRETAKKACEKFARAPTSVMNFVEGTRFTPRKHAAQSSPYRHLLKPRTGALATTLSAMGSRFTSMLDITIVYPDGTPTFWQFLCGGTRRIVVRCTQVPVPPQFCLANYEGDAAFRKELHQWLSDLWSAKDQQIEALLRGDAAKPAGT